MFPRAPRSQSPIRPPSHHRPRSVPKAAREQRPPRDPAERPPVHAILQCARQRAGITQHQLAEAISAWQSAICQFERRGSGLSQEKIDAIVRVLRVDLDDVPDDLMPPSAPLGRFSLWYCPRGSCPSAVPHVVDGRIVYEPRMVRCAAERRWCTSCGEVMLNRCEGCGAPAEKGAFCAACGRRRVHPSPSDPAEDREAEQWAAEVRAGIEQARRLTEIEEAPTRRGSALAKPKPRE